MRIGRGLPGRGAWLCPDETCMEAALRRRALGRALRAELSDSAIDEFRSAFVEAAGGARG